jgi:hypothetical protein
VIIRYGHPYPETGLTTERWVKEVPIRLVALDELVTTQTHVSIASILHRHRRAADPYPYVVSYLGLLYLEDGHGRVVRAMLDGHTHYPCRVFERH